MNRNYLPILKAREGELKALSQLYTSTKGSLTPLIDIPRKDLDKENGNATKNLESHLVKVGNKIRLAWGNKLPFFVDLHDIDLTERLSDDTHPMNYLMEHLRRLGLNAIPTTDLERDENYNLALAQEINKGHKGCLIRIYEEDMINIHESYTELSNLFKMLNLTPENIHILLDFRSILGRKPYEIASIAIDIINELPNAKNWSSLTIAASGMPQTLSELVKPGERGVIKRSEFETFKIVLSNGNKLKRTPDYGDYTIVHPVHLPIKPKAMNFAPSIRYTTSDEWVILRGISAKKHPQKMKQYYALSEELIQHDDFQGSDFCYGDREITRISNSIGSPGTLKIWVSIGCNSPELPSDLVYGLN